MINKKILKRSITWGDKELSFEIGKVAHQANVSVLGRYGDTMVLVTVVTAEKKEDQDYFPLSVEFEERLYASGAISTSRFIKREGRPSEEAVLSGRLIDRSLRPLFTKGFEDVVQIIVTVLSYDQENNPDIVGLLTASLALSISDLPWEGPITAARVGYKEGEYMLNPTNAELEFSNLDLIVSSTKDKTVMLEAGAKQVSEDIILNAVKFARENSREVLKLIEDITKEIGIEKRAVEKPEFPKEVQELIDFIRENIDKIIVRATPDEADKKTREKRMVAFSDEIHEKFDQKLSKAVVESVFKDQIKSRVRSLILEDGKRPDGRKFDEVREVTAEVGLLPRTHGSGLFTRGETQILTVATLGSTSLEQLIEGMRGADTKRYMHHYNFPPFAVGEAGRMGSPGRREIGHGALAERALLPVIPVSEDFPYTIRLVSETLGSNGSSSMGSVCGSTLALMDAGVPIVKPVAGVAMGLASDESGKYQVLTDLQDFEDVEGGMDFKIAGTDEGVTAIQMDTKTHGLTDQMVEDTLKQARGGRMHILEKMLSALPESRREVSKYAPKVKMMMIDPDKIGMVIGSGGKTIKSIIEATGAAIDIEDNGQVVISAVSEESVEKAAKWVEGLTHEAKAGEVYKGLVKRILPFGAFVEILPGKEGLVHISQIADHRVEDISKEVKIGDRVVVKVLEIDSQGRVNLTMKFKDKPTDLD